jgi:ABC-type Mn2+/Zn2+ transport system permease subunit
VKKITRLESDTVNRTLMIVTIIVSIITIILTIISWISMYYIRNIYEIGTDLTIAFAAVTVMGASLVFFLKLREDLSKKKK